MVCGMLFGARYRTQLTDFTLQHMQGKLIANYGKFCLFVAMISPQWKAYILAIFIVCCQTVPTICSDLIFYIFDLQLNKYAADPVSFASTTLLSITVLSVILSLFFYKIMKYPPTTVVKVLFLFCAGCQLAYLTQVYLGLTNPSSMMVGCAFVVGGVRLVHTYSDMYFGRHILPEVSQLYSISLATLNTSVAVYGHLIGSVVILIAGTVFTLCSEITATAVITIGATVFTLICLAILWKGLDGCNAVPEDNIKRSSCCLWTGVVGQFEVYFSQEVVGVLLGKVIGKLGQQSFCTFIQLYFLAEGVSAMELSIGKSSYTILSLVGALVYPLKNRAVRQIPLSNIILSTSVVYVIACLYWVLYEALSINNMMELKSQMLLFFLAINVLIGVFETWSNLAWAELIQINIAPADRGSVAGLELMLGLIVTMIKLLVILNLPTEYVYLILFAMTLVSQCLVFVLVLHTKVRLRRACEERSEEDSPMLADKLKL